MLILLTSLAMSQVQEMGSYGVNVHGISWVTIAMKLSALNLRNFQMNSPMIKQHTGSGDISIVNV